MPPKKSKKTNKPEVEGSKNLATIVADFTKDLSNTFPEYAYLWEKWTKPLEEQEIVHLHQYFSKIMPERFFDILYQNEDIFLPTSEINTLFLPNVEFKLLYNCENITKNTKGAIWKYLQLILFTLTPSFKHKGNFGDSAGLFEGIDESELQDKITEAVSGIGDFFKNLRETDSSSSTSQQEEEEKQDEGEKREEYKDNGDGEKGEDKEKGEKDSSWQMPNANNIFENLKGLFDGKIGKLAQELAGEMSEEFKDMFEGGEGEGDPKDVFKKLLKDPKRIMSLVQKLTGKLKSKFQSGEINQEDMMKEAQQFMKQFKDMGGANGEQFKEMFQNMTKGMGLGKNAKMDMNALSRMEKQMEMKERMRRNVEKKRAENIQLVDGKQVFRLDGHEKQEKSSKEDIERIMAELNLTNDEPQQSKLSKKKKKAKK